MLKKKRLLVRVWVRFGSGFVTETAQLATCEASSLQGMVRGPDFVLHQTALD